MADEVKSFVEEIKSIRSFSYFPSDAPTPPVNKFLSKLDRIIEKFEAETKSTTFLEVGEDEVGIVLKREEGKTFLGIPLALDRTDEQWDITVKIKNEIAEKLKGG